MKDEHSTEEKYLAIVSYSMTNEHKLEDEYTAMEEVNTDIISDVVGINNSIEIAFDLIKNEAYGKHENNGVYANDLYECWLCGKVLTKEQMEKGVCLNNPKDV